jgi:hypothetical protein
MSVAGQTEKNSLRANVFRVVPESRHQADIARGPKSAISGSRRAFSTARTSKDPMTRMHDRSGGHHPGTARAGSHEPRLIASHSGPEGNLRGRLPQAFVSLTVGPHPQEIQALQLKKRAACRSLFSECAHGSLELRLT